MRTIQYAINTETGLVVSRVDSELAWPILEYDNILPENNYAVNYHLDKISVGSVVGYSWSCLKWTRKILKEIKNFHREFWNFPLLK